MSWFDDILSGAESFAKDPFGGKILDLGLGYLLSESGINDPKIPQTGYQGGVPDYAAVRREAPVSKGTELTSGEIRPMGTPAPTGIDAIYAPKPTGRMIPMSYDPNRRPGSGGRRYFTDVQYVAPESVDAAKAAADVQATELMERNIANPARRTRPASMPKPLAQGGTVKLQEGRYLDGNTDGMADEVEAIIGEEQPAALSDGEYVIPADVVSHLGNGNSDAGAKVLDGMIAKIRKARTGEKEQAPEIEPEDFLPV